MVFTSLTVITAAHNAALVLPCLLDSLAVQTCRDFELILQDGASTDTTLALAESYNDKFPALSLESSPDTGIYDAWNKALSRARGEWILFLGADDRLAGPEVLAQAKEHLASIPPEVMFAAGTMELELPDGNIEQTFLPQVTDIKSRLLRGMPAPHTALFHRRALFDNNRFDTSFRIAGDYEFLCRTWTDDSLGRPLDIVITRMGWGGVSTRPQAALAVRLEEAKAASKHFPRAWMAPRRIKSLAGGLAIAGLCRIIGPIRAAALLDRLRMLRGLPPCWGSDIRHE